MFHHLNLCINTMQLLKHLLKYQKKKTWKHSKIMFYRLMLLFLNRIHQQNIEGFVLARPWDDEEQNSLARLKDFPSPRWAPLSAPTHSRSCRRCARPSAKPGAKHLNSVSTFLSAQYENNHDLYKRITDLDLRLWGHVGQLLFANGHRKHGLRCGDVNMYIKYFITFSQASV